MNRMNRRVVVPSLLGIFVTLFPFLIVVAALPDIAADFGTGEATLAWALTLPLIAGAVILPTSGRLGDLHGHRRLFLIGLTASAVFAVLSALAWDPVSLIVFRTISQAGGSAVGPAAIALMVSTHEPADRPRVLGLWAFAISTAPALGLLAGGPAVDAITWRGLFLVQGIASFAAVGYAARSLPETPTGGRVSFDVRGATVFMVTSGALVFGLDRAGRWGWAHPAVWISLVLGAVSAVAFVGIERHVTEPILAPELLRNASYVSSCGIEFLIQTATNGGLFVLPLLLSANYDAGIGRIAWCMAPMPIGMAVSSPLSGRVVARLGGRATAVTGMVAVVLALVVMTAADRAGSLAILLVGWGVVGMGNGIVRPAIASAAAAALDPADYGAGLAAARMISTVGAGAGITLAISVGSGREAFAVGAGAALIGAVASRWLAEVDDGLERVTANVRPNSSAM